MNAGQLRRVLTFVFATASTAAPFVACVTSESARDLDDDGGASDAFVLPEASPVDAEADVQGADAGSRDADTCSEGGFCSVPVQGLVSLVGVGASSMNDAWAIARNAILRWDGSAWKKVYVHDGTSPDFYAIHVVAPDDVWVLGTGIIVRYSALGSAPPTFRSYASSFHGSAADVTASWMDPSSRELWTAADAKAKGVVGYRYREQSDGSITEVSMLDAPISFPWSTPDAMFFARSIFGFASDDVYVGGDLCNVGGKCQSSAERDRYGAIAHYDGQTWSMVATLDKAQRVSAMFGVAGPDSSRRLWVLSGTPSVSRSSSLRLLPVAADGALGAAEFTRTIQIDSPPASPLKSVSSGCSRLMGSVLSANEAWFSDVCFVYRWNGSSLDVVSTAINGLPLGHVMGIWGGSADQAWLVGEYARSSDPAGTLPLGFAAKREGSLP